MTPRQRMRPWERLQNSKWRFAKAPRLLFSDAKLLRFSITSLLSSTSAADKYVIGKAAASGGRGQERLLIIIKTQRWQGSLPLTSLLFQKSFFLQRGGFYCWVQRYDIMIISEGNVIFAWPWCDLILPKTFKHPVRAVFEVFKRQLQICQWKWL